MHTIYTDDLSKHDSGFMIRHSNTSHVILILEMLILPYSHWNLKNVMFDK